MIRIICAALLLFAFTVAAPAVLAGTPTSHLLPLQGYATDAEGVALPSADPRVLIYGTPSGGTALYDSGTDFVGSVSYGFLDVVLGAITPLSLDNTRLYYMEIVLDGVEILHNQIQANSASPPRKVYLHAELVIRAPGEFCLQVDDIFGLTHE